MNYQPQVVSSMDFLVAINSTYTSWGHLNTVGAKPPPPCCNPNCSSRSAQPSFQNSTANNSIKPSISRSFLGPTDGWVFFFSSEKKSLEVFFKQRWKGIVSGPFERNGSSGKPSFSGQFIIDPEPELFGDFGARMPFLGDFLNPYLFGWWV